MSESSAQPEAKAESAAKRGEILAWASYDVANSTYATVVATAVYNAYFVTVIVHGGHQNAGQHGLGTLLLSITIAISSLLVVISAPILGTIADATASKKQMLFASTLCCILATAALSLIKPGQYLPAMVLLILANLAFGTGENFIASFLPELAPKAKMGSISAIGWGAGYIGGIFSLGAALAYVYFAEHHGIPSTVYVPKIMVGCAVMFAVLCTPTILWLKERAKPDRLLRSVGYVKVSFQRLQETFMHTRYYRDLFNILIAICVYTCGTATVTHIASVYAQTTLNFTQQDSLIMILVVDLTAAIGAFAFGLIQDRIGSVRTLTFALSIWTVAVVVAFFAQTKPQLWIAGNILGIAMGACGSAGRALVGRFSPPGKSGEFLGLWGLAMKAASCIGILVFGIVTYLTGGDLRWAMLCLSAFFIVGIVLVLRVDEARGIAAAEQVLPFDEPT